VKTSLKAKERHASNNGVSDRFAEKIRGKEAGEIQSRSPFPSFFPRGDGANAEKISPI